MKVFDIYPAHFSYIMGMFYTICLMIIPYSIGIVIVKIVMQALICGYCVERCKSVWGYFVFFLRPVEADFTLSIHRMPVYGIIYFFFFIKVYYDNKDNKYSNWQDITLVSFVGSILMIWRKEGIYFLVSLPLLILLSYKHKKGEWKKSLLLCYSIVLITYIPELYSYMGNGSFTAESMHSYNSFFVNMKRLGLDDDKYQEYYEKIDKVLSIEAVDRINEDYGDLNYESELIASRSEYEGIRPNYSADDYYQYEKSIQYIIFHEPLLFLRSRFGMWNAVSFGYGHIRRGDSILRILYHLVLFNLYIPLVAVIALLILSVYKREKGIIVLACGVIVHVAITFLLAPTAFLKYYYHLYLIGWFLIFIGMHKFVLMKLNKFNVIVDNNMN